MTRAQILMRRMLTCLLLAMALAVSATQASAQDVTVRGTGTCQTYLDAKRSNDVQEAMKDLMWLLGYVSGLARATHVDVFGNHDAAESMLDWFDAYCERFPAKYISDAGDMFYTYRVEQMKGSYPK